jgi:hypothetical protein
VQHSLSFACGTVLIGAGTVLDMQEGVPILLQAHEGLSCLVQTQSFICMSSLPLSVQIPFSHTLFWLYEQVIQLTLWVTGSTASSFATLCVAIFGPRNDFPGSGPAYLCWAGNSKSYGAGKAAGAALGAGSSEAGKRERGFHVGRERIRQVVVKLKLTVQFSKWSRQWLVGSARG